MDVDRRVCESGAIARDDHIDGMSNGSGSQYVVFKIWAAPFDSIAKDVTRHRHYLERLETNSNSVTLGTCVLGSVPSHEVRECVDATGNRAALNPRKIRDGSGFSRLPKIAPVPDFPARGVDVSACLPVGAVGTVSAVGPAAGAPVATVATDPGRSVRPIGAGPRGRLSPATGPKLGRTRAG